MGLTEWNLEHITLVSVTLYFILSLLALAAFIISRQIYITRKSSADYLPGIAEGKQNSSLFTTTAVRLLTCWLFAFSAAFLAFARLQCGSDLSVPPYFCSIVLQFFVACEMQFLASEQVYNRLCLTGLSKWRKCVVLKFLIISMGIPLTLVCCLHYLIGPEYISNSFVGTQECDTVFTTTPAAASHSIVSPPIVPPSEVDRTPEGIYDQNADAPSAREADRAASKIKIENCWISWMSTSVRVTSAFGVFLLITGVAVTWMNVVTLLRKERHGKRVTYGCWWGVAARVVVMVITMAKWASVAFQSTCSSNLYNIYATLIVMPVLLAVMFCGNPQDQPSCRIATVKPRKFSEAKSPAHDVIELTNLDETSAMLHHDVENGDVTPHVTHEKELYVARKFFEGGKDRSHEVAGENHWTSYNGGQRTFPKAVRDRHSTDVDDGVISNDGDYEASRTNFDSIDAEARVTSSHDVAYDVNENKSDPKRLSHAESTDSGMGFSDNPRDCDARLSDAMAPNEGDNYGTIKPLVPQPRDGESSTRPSSAEDESVYDEVAEFVSNSEAANGDQQNAAEDSEGALCNAQTSSKYAELDLAKILHTRRRHKNILTAPRKEPEEEKPQEIGIFDSLKRKSSKAKNLPIGSYATYGRNRKPSRQYSNETWTLRPSSTCNESEDPLPALSDKSRHYHSTSLNHKSNYTLHNLSLNDSQASSTFSPRSALNSDLMMTSDIQEEAVGVLDVERRDSWRMGAISPPVVGDTTPTNELGNNRWSWISNSSHNEVEKHSTPKSTWGTIRRLFGWKSSDSKDVSSHKPTRSASTMSTSNLSSRSRSSIFRRFSSKKSNKSNQSLNKRRNSAPSKSEWDVNRPVDEDVDLEVGPLRSPVVAHPRLTAPRPPVSKSKGKFGSRLMSFRGSKNKSSKYSKDSSAMSNSKGLSISSPQLSIHAIDPTRNYSEHQLLNLSTAAPALR